MYQDLLRGHLDGMILAVLEPAPQHGYAIMEALRVRSGGGLDLPTGSLYPALRRLERAGYLDSTWHTVSGRRRRTYRITRAGRRALATERTDWHNFAAIVNGLLDPTANPGTS